MLVQLVWVLLRVVFVSIHDLFKHVCAVGFLRNALCFGGQVKIADFGLSRRVTQTKQYYKLNNSEALLPFRWVAPENLLGGATRFTQASDALAVSRRRAPVQLGQPPCRAILIRGACTSGRGDDARARRSDGEREGRGGGV